MPSPEYVAATGNLVSSKLLIFFEQTVFQLLKVAWNPEKWSESPGSP
jgi:hypothetical protein